jgi:PEP-CTERM motif
VVVLKNLEPALALSNVVFALGCELEHIHYFCGNTEIASDLQEREPQRAALYKATVALVRAYAFAPRLRASASYGVADISTGNGGNIIAGGISPVTQILIQGPIIWSGLVYQITVSNLSIYLPAGHYWLNVTPIGNGPAILPNMQITSSLFVTNGSNAIGPRSAEGDSFWDSTYYNVSFQPGESQFGVGLADFSMGVAGSIVPEPATWALMLIGFASLGFAFRQSRRKMSFA